MTQPRLRAALIVVLTACVGVAAFVAGSQRAPGKGDAAAERQRAFDAAFVTAMHAATSEARPAGITDGEKAGRSAGEGAGERRGSADGQATAEAAQAEVAAAEAEAAKQAALEEVRERSANCDAPLFVEGYCPTDEEVAQENLAESLCGPGTAEGRREAAAHGIDC